MCTKRKLYPESDLQITNNRNSVDRKSGGPVAIKVIDLETADDDVDDIVQEIKILSQMKSRYVTQYFGSYLHGAHLWIVMEYCGGGSCADLLKAGIIPEDYIAIIMREILKGLVYLHSERKIHRDIKAANVLLTASGEIKLADFGVSGQLTASTLKKRTFVGTPVCSFSLSVTLLLLYVNTLLFSFGWLPRLLK